VTERPILFSAPMVRAYRREVDPKMQTRRTSGLKKINAEPDAWEYCYAGGVDSAWHTFTKMHVSGTDDVLKIRCPYGVAGDRLWTREGMIRPDGDPWLYTADNEPVMVDPADETGMIVWAHHKQQDYCPSMFMPRWASRDTLEVISARPERLHDITEADAKSEGVEILEMSQSDIDDIQISDSSPDEKKFWKAMGPGSSSHRWEYEMLWGEINGPGSWAKNPWVWRVEFRRL